LLIEFTITVRIESWGRKGRMMKDVARTALGKEEMAVRLRLFGTNKCGAETRC
jgi:hypothetical protein